MSKDFSKDISNIGYRIAEARKAKGMTQKQLADEANIEYQSMSRIEHGASNMGIKTLLAIFAALDADLSYIFQDIYNKEASDPVKSLFARLGMLTDDKKENIIKAIDFILKASGI